MKKIAFRSLLLSFAVIIISCNKEDNSNDPDTNEQTFQPSMKVGPYNGMMNLMKPK
jgi:uncharacterized protein (DUF2236 family)